MARPADERVAYDGRKFRIIWAMDRTGGWPAEQYFEALEESDQAKFLTLFQYLGDHGWIRSQEKFRRLTDEGIWEFKIHGHRLIGDYRPGGLFVISHGAEKKSDELLPAEFEVTRRVLKDHDDRKAGE